jgi:hypothetical protein
VEDLHCPRGKAHFGIETNGAQEKQHHHFHDKENMTIDDEVISLLRRCGHYLHHNMNAGGGEELLSALSEGEKKELIKLLNKCRRN